MRSKYIYLVYHKDCAAILSAFTVKYEAQKWAEKYGIEKLMRYRITDGSISNNPPVICPWE